MRVIPKFMGNLRGPGKPPMPRFPTPRKVAIAGPDHFLWVMGFPSINAAAAQAFFTPLVRGSLVNSKGSLKNEGFRVLFSWQPEIPAILKPVDIWLNIKLPPHTYGKYQIIYRVNLHHVRWCRFFSFHQQYSTCQVAPSQKETLVFQPSIIPGSSIYVKFLPFGRFFG